jgi:hypothetical protein
MNKFINLSLNLQSVHSLSGPMQRKDFEKKETRRMQIVSIDPLHSLSIIAGNYSYSDNKLEKFLGENVSKSHDAHFVPSV